MRNYFESDRSVLSCHVRGAESWSTVDMNYSQFLSAKKKINILNRVFLSWQTQQQALHCTSEEVITCTAPAGGSGPYRSILLLESSPRNPVNCVTDTKLFSEMLEILRWAGGRGAAEGGSPPATCPMVHWVHLFEYTWIFLQTCMRVHLHSFPAIWTYLQYVKVQ